MISRVAITKKLAPMLTCRSITEGANIELRNRMPLYSRHCLLYIRSSDPASEHRVTQKKRGLFSYLESFVEVII